MGYEVYERSNVRVEDPALAITTDGRIGLNAAACRLLLAAKIDAVLILWDKTARKMGVKGAAKGDKNAFSVSFAPGSSSATVTAKTFLHHIGWSAPKRVTLAATWNAKERMFEVWLKGHYLAPTQGKFRKI